MFVPANQVKGVASETGAIPFDVHNVELGHHESRCSFESIILKYELKDPALMHLAKIVHAADVTSDTGIKKEEEPDTLPLFNETKSAGS